MTVTIHQKSILELRDIRSDLDDRIRALNKVIEKEQAEFEKRQEEAAAEHRKKMDSLRRALSNYKQMYDLEGYLLEQLPAPPHPDKIGPVEEVKISMPTPRLPLADFFISELKQRGPLVKEELREAAQAAGYFIPGDGGGRTTHATLSNIMRSKRIALIATGNGIIKYKAIFEQEEKML